MVSFGLVVCAIRYHCEASFSYVAVVLGCFVFCFFKQKTAYEMLRSLVGSEMCIRDRTTCR